MPLNKEANKPTKISLNFDIKLNQADNKENEF